MATIFQALPNNRNPLLALLGIVPHRIVPADERLKPSSSLITVHQVDQLLKNVVDVGICTSDEAGVLRDQAVAAGLPVDNRALLQRVLEQQVRGELGDNLSFRMCTAENCTTLPDLGHGEVYIGEERVTDPIKSIEELFEALHRLVGEERSVITPQQAVLLMRQVRDAGLALDKAERRERYAALPDDVKLAHQQRLEQYQRQMLDNFGIRVEAREDGVRVVLLEVNLGRLMAEAEPPPPSLFERIFGRRG